MDEEYFAAFFSAVLSGSTDPELQQTDTGKRIFQRNPSLRKRIERSKSSSEDGLLKYWRPEEERIKKVVVMLAKGHLFHENGEPHLEEPSKVFWHPISDLSSDQREFFFPSFPQQDIWPEVGSRWMQKICEEIEEFDDYGYHLFQPGVYHYRLFHGGVGVQMIIRDYLACYVEWE